MGVLYLNIVNVLIMLIVWVNNGKTCCQVHSNQILQQTYFINVHSIFKNIILLVLLLVLLVLVLLINLFITVVTVDQ